MILADKIMDLRKKNGWSQEDADAVHPCCRDRRGNLPVQDV